MVMRKVGKRGKIGVAIGILAMLGASYFFLGSKKSDESGSITTLAVPTTLPDKDSDGDGLKDWEEALWNTDPQVADTDEDGTSDGQEVATRRDPAKAGPSDKMLPVTSPTPGTDGTTKAYAYEYDPKLGSTPTEKLALNLTSNYLLSSAGQPLSDAEKASLVSNLVADTAKALPSPKVFALSSLKVRPTTDESLLDYFNALATILQNASPGSIDEAVIMQSVMTSNNLNDMVALKKIGVKFSQAATKMIALSVPERLAAYHLAFANDFAQAGWGLETMGGGDPILALIGMNAYRSAYTDLTTKIAPTLFAPITKGEISISRDEPASFFIQ
ncbi:MAG TPA: hypothetical protein VI953_04745 [Candidatus Paceibacterota bacterium]